MTVADLIAALQGMPQDAEVMLYQRETETHYGTDESINSIRLDQGYVNAHVVLS